MTTDHRTGSIPASVAVAQLDEAVYPSEAPFSPSHPYPEYPFTGELSSIENKVYDGVRELFRLLGFDRENFGKGGWNPLGQLISSGMTVVVKPNFVLSRHSGGKDLFSIITHPSVIRAVADYCWIALSGKGRIVIADAPQYDCNFGELMEATKLGPVEKFYRSHAGPSVEVRDLRKYWSRWKHFDSLLEPLPGDPEGNILIRLGRRSMLFNKPGERKLYGAVYHRDETISHHSGETHDYELSGTIMNADVVVSLPKLKVHKKVGVTLNAKGLVGTCTNKNFLVHYTLTPPSRGGDQYPDRLFTGTEEKLIKLERWMYDHLLASGRRPLEYLHRSIYWLHNHMTKKLGIMVDPAKRLMDAGNWYGNDSAWRMTIDLLRSFYYADRSGKLTDSVQRKTFSVVDGVTGGENNGPLSPDPKASGVLIAGQNFAAVDLVAARLMGFDPGSIRIYSEILHDRTLSLGIEDPTADIKVISPRAEWENCFADSGNRYLGFKPHPGWTGHIEATAGKISESIKSGVGD